MKRLSRKIATISTATTTAISTRSAFAAIGGGEGALGCKSGNVGLQGGHGEVVNADQFRDVLFCHFHRGLIAAKR